jgi:hypothetical protein
MKIKTSWDDDEITFAGFGSASPITEYAKPKKRKRKKFKVGFVPRKAKGGERISVGFAIPKKGKS